MVKFYKSLMWIAGLVGIGAAIVLCSCGPIKAFFEIEPYTGTKIIQQDIHTFDTTRKTVVILASHKGTEIFDLLAPFELFSSTGKLNVWILAPERQPIPLWKGAYLFPSMTLEEFDAKMIVPDLIAIPNIVDPNNPEIQRWLRKYGNQLTLSICEGARVVAESQLYNNRSILSHSSSIPQLKEKYKNMSWVTGRRYLQHNNLISTAGVSAAFEGALKAIELLLHTDDMERIIQTYNYPYDVLDTEFNGRQIQWTDQLNILGKVVFSKNDRILGILNDGISELELAAVLDTYTRTFPQSLHTITPTGQSSVVSKYGLQLFGTTSQITSPVDQIHCFLNDQSPLIQSELANIPKRRNAQVLFYDQMTTTSFILDVLMQQLQQNQSPGIVKFVSDTMEYPPNKQVKSNGKSSR